MDHKLVLIEPPSDLKKNEHQFISSDKPPTSKLNKNSVLSKNKKTQGLRQSL